MTGDELTTLLLRHGVEVTSAQHLSIDPRGYLQHIVHCRDIAAAALSPEMLPSNVELILHNEEHHRDHYGYLGSGAIGMTTGFREEIRRMEGRGNFVLTSAPPRTTDQQRQAITQPVRRNAVTVPSRRFDGPSVPARTTPTAPPRRVNDAEVLARIQNHLEASPRRFHWFTDAELRALGKSACTPPWQRLECAIRDGVSAATVAQLLPSNVFLPLGGTTTGLWGSREDEVFVAGDGVATRPATNPQGFRADLWQRICDHCVSPGYQAQIVRFNQITEINDSGVAFAEGQFWNWTSNPGQADILARWTVYQQLKPLYDIVDGDEGTVPVPQDVIYRWWTDARPQRQALIREAEFIRCTSPSDRYPQMRGPTCSWYADGSDSLDRSLRNFTVILNAVAEARVAAATTSPAQQQPPTIRRWDAADLRRAISSDYEIVAVTPMRANPQTTPKDGRYRVDVRLLETRGYYCSTTILPRGVIVCYDVADGGTTHTIHGENDGLVADLDDWTPTQQVNEAELRTLVLGLPNVLGISGHIERGSRQRDRYIVRVTLVDRDAPLDSALASQIPGNVHIHCQGRGEGGMRGVRGTATAMYVPQQHNDHIVDAVAHTTTQHLQRRLDYDGLVALLRRHLGDDVRVTSIKAGREGHFDVEVTSIREYGIPWHEVPGNVTLTINGGIITGTSSQVFDPGRRVLVDKAPPTPRYFDADGDTVTTPDKAPPWLHQMVAEVRAKSASWRRNGSELNLYFELRFAHTLTESHIRRIQHNSRSLKYNAAITSTNAPAPRVPVCMVRAIREQRDLAVLMPSPEERDLTMEWQQMPANNWRNVVVDIVENGCAGLDDEAAAERASCYHLLMVEAAQAKTELAEYVRQWCAQFQTRFALLEVDDADHTEKPRQRSAVLKRGKKPLTLAAVTKFRELMASRMCPSTAEAAKQAGIDSEVAVYVLQRWCGGLGDEEALALLNKVAGHPSHSSGEISTESVDTIAATVLQCNRPALDVAAALPPSVQAADEAAKKQRLVLAQVAEQLRQERQRRAAQVARQPVQELSRFALLDVDERRQIRPR